MSVDDIVNDLYGHLCGSCEDPLCYIDQLIEDEELDKEFFRENEMEILGKLDDRMFTCARCGWNYDTCDFGNDEFESVCINCEDEE